LSLAVFDPFKIIKVELHVFISFASFVNIGWKYGEVSYIVSAIRLTISYNLPSVLHPTIKNVKSYYSPLANGATSHRVSFNAFTCLRVPIKTFFALKAASVRFPVPANLNITME